MNHKFKYLFLFIFSITLLTSCEKEDVVITETSQDNLRLKEEYITLEDLQTMPQAMEVLRKIEEKQTTSPNKRSVYNKDYDFFVDTSRILKIDNGDYHSLTFPVFRLEDNGLVENLVLSEEDDGYSAALYTYKFSPKQRKEVEEGSPVYEAKEVSRKVLNFDSSTVGFRIKQIWYTDIVVIPCSSGQHGAKNFGKWGECIAGRKAQLLVITRSILIDDASDYWVEGAEYNRFVSPGGGGGTGSDWDTYNPNIPPFDPNRDMALVEGKITRPLIPLPSKEQNFYNNDLSGENSDLRYVMNDTDVRVPLLQYLDQNDYSEESRNIAIEILQQIYDGNIDVDKAEDIIELAQSNPDVAEQMLDFLDENSSDVNKEIVGELIDALNEYVDEYPADPELIQDFLESVIHPEDVDEDEIEVPPSCESFNFVSVLSNWQAAAVSNISFQINVIAPPSQGGNYIQAQILFEQPTLFECPKVLATGNTQISPGLAATVSARALKQSMGETVKKYGNKPISEMMIRIFFKSRLKRNYPFFIPGGRATFNAGGFTVTPTQYKTTAFGSDDCT